jgi:hypothetical protein
MIKRLRRGLIGFYVLLQSKYWKLQGSKKIKNERCAPKELHAHPYGFG